MEKDVNNFFNKAYDAFKNKDYKSAIEYFTEVIRLDSTLYEAYYNRANAKANINDEESYKSAVEDYTWALKLNDKHALAYNSLAYINIQFDRINNSYDKLNYKAYNYFEKAYSFAGKEDKKLIIKCLISLSKENIETAKTFCLKNNINY